MIILGSGVLIFKNRTPEEKKEPIQIHLRSKDGDFRLSDQAFSITLVYFGFLSCPDICPSTLNSLSAILKDLNEEKLSKIRVLFIDVDPERDDISRLHDYVTYFHPSILALTGTEKELLEIAGKFYATFQKVPLDSEMGYTMDHSTGIYILDGENIWRETIPHGVSKEIFMSYLNKYF